ncbi:transporter substrate-binding domain-containing protein [Butyrivibrio sp. INlla16]|uniref:transporter substrate-binding domain-containing protein n=1 Tax=Butyrivibrio sp. INlla16 TaxID=1520807 RepID=UPI000882F606|nr:transporter substrate-binding domain-containing protein [Butyrivibrio sp. INlla16]SDB51023.1 polar amino acid transport system substrate-binding protein [Butyrivibrio sp. INlla16]
MKKKLISAILIGAMTFSMTACGGASKDAEAPAQTEQSAETAESTDATEEAAGEEASAGAEISTVTPGKLTVATSPDFAPYEFYAVGDDGTPTLAGFDIALAQYIADYLGLELEVVPVDFDGVLMELQTKAVDLGVAGLSPDPKRESIMDFSDIYYEGGQSFVCLQSNKDQFASLEDTNNPDIEVGAQTGAIQVDLAQANSPDAELIQLTKVTDIIAELLAGKLDGAYIETAVAESYAKNYPELCVALDVPYDGAEGSAIGISKGNDALKAGVNEAIAKAKAEGKMDEFVATANELASGEIIEGLLDQ